MANLINGEVVYSCAYATVGTDVCLPTILTSRSFETVSFTFTRGTDVFNLDIATDVNGRAILPPELTVWIGETYSVTALDFAGDVVYFLISGSYYVKAQIIFNKYL